MTKRYSRTVIAIGISIAALALLASKPASNAWAEAKANPKEACLSACTQKRTNCMQQALRQNDMRAAQAACTADLNKCNAACPK